MAEFSGKILSAVYINEEFSIIKVRYEDGDAISVYNLEANESDQDYQDLLAEGWDAEKIMDETAEAKKAESAAFNAMVNDAARQLLEETQESRAQIIEKSKAQIKEEAQREIEKVKEQFTKRTEDYFEFMINDDDKDNLFKFKLWALESIDAKTAPKELKSKLRKAKSILEGFAVLHEIKSQQ